MSFQEILDQALTRFNLIREKTLNNNLHNLDLRNLFFCIYRDYNGKVVIFSQKLMDLNYKTKHSLLLARLLEYWARHSRWLLFALSSGMYKESMMQQRFILESWVQAYYLDFKYSNLTLQEKIELLEKNEEIPNKKKPLPWYGRFVFHDRHYKNTAISTDIYDFYRKLCNYTHSSFDELKHLLKSESETDLLIRTTPEYSEDSFELCMQCFHQLQGYLISLLDSFFEEKLEFKRKKI